jgi:hypothetical protein
MTKGAHFQAREREYTHEVAHVDSATKSWKILEE